jgi:hypothetical protein
MSGSEFKLSLPRVHTALDVFALLANRPTAQFSRIWADMIIYSHKHSCCLATPNPGRAAALAPHRYPSIAEA